jgi:norsolorinic acid ketoreductase
MSTFNVLITGTKAGIGQGLLAAFAAKPNTTVIAAIRDSPSSEKAQSMIAAITEIGYGSRVIPMQYDAGLLSSAQELVDGLKNSESITHIDTVIANAGIASQWGDTKDVQAEEVLTLFRVNTMGPLLLYQATRDLLLAAKGEPNFFLVSSVLGSVTKGPHIPFKMVAYGMSKAAGNYFARKTNIEEDRIVVVPVHPGWVQTAMGDGPAVKLGLNSAPMTIDFSVGRLMKLFDSTDKEASKGGFLCIDDEGESPW